MAFGAHAAQRARALLRQRHAAVVVRGARRRRPAVKQYLSLVARPRDRAHRARHTVARPEVLTSRITEKWRGGHRRRRITGTQGAVINVSCKCPLARKMIGPSRGRFARYRAA